MSGKKVVVIRAPLLSLSGYGIHSRQIFKWLLSKDVELKAQVVPWGNTTWMINPDLEKGLVGQIMERTDELPKNVIPDVSFQVQLPNEWDPNLAKVNVGVSAWVETDICNRDWIPAASRMTHLVVPSQFTKDVVDKSGAVGRPIHVIPESYPEEIDHDVTVPLPLNLTTSFNFLVVGQLTGNDQENDRKNLFRTLKWICEVFQDDPTVGIILKTNGGRGTTLDRRNMVRTVGSIVQNVRKGKYPKVYLLHGNMSTDEIVSLYKEKTVKGLVSLTRGEGYGLPLLEAAASGLPVIATNWSGHLDFLKNGRFIPIDYSLSEIPNSRVDNVIFVKGSKWAEPLESDFKRKIAKFRNSSEIPKQWAADLAPKIREKFSQDAVCKLYDEKLGDLL